MDPSRPTPNSARPSRSPSPTSGPHLPSQVAVNTLVTITTSTPQQGFAIDLVVGGDPAVVCYPRATAGPPQNTSQPGQSSPVLQISGAFPNAPINPAASPIATLLPSAFRLPSEGLTREHSRSVGSLETRPRRVFRSTSSLYTIGLASKIHKSSRGRGRTHGPGGLAAQDVKSNDIVDGEQSGTPTHSAPVKPAARIRDSRVVRQGFHVPFRDIRYWFSGPEQEIFWKSFPRQMMGLAISTFLVTLTLLLILSNLGWWDFESCGSQGRGGVRLAALSVALLVCILWLKLRSDSYLWSREENIERGELSTPATPRLQIAKEEPDLFCKLCSAEALPPPLPYLPPSSSGPSRSEFRFLPTGPSFLGWVSEPKGDPDQCGGYSDVWKCFIRFCEPSNGHPIEVAVKVLRKVDLHQFGDAESHQRILARFQQEGITWSGLAHPNIVPLIGYTLAPSPRFISPWYRKGSLRQYLTKNTRVHRLKLLHGIAKALDYLHSRIPRIAHGDIKPENVLIDDQNEPRLADFGLATILGEEHMYTISQQQAGTRRWMAPEQILGGSRSCESDTYSFGSLAFWVMTSKMPFANLSDNGIIFAVNDHTKPVSPVQDWNKYPELESSLRDIIRDCWSPVPEERPSMSLVEERLAALVESSDGCAGTVPREASS